MKHWLQITSGRGPAECGWVAARVVDLIMRDANQKELRAQIVEAVPGGNPDTLKSALLCIDSDQDISNFVLSWKGTIQWVGKSMYRPKHKRKNWFIGITTFEQKAGNMFHSHEIKIESMKSSGPGGQHVNKTESAIRVTHIPTGLSAIARDQRSQHLNKKIALIRLEGLMRQKQETDKKGDEQTRWGRHNTLERGNAIRVFVGPKFKPKR